MTENGTPSDTLMSFHEKKRWSCLASFPQQPALTMRYEGFFPANWFSGS